MSLNMIPMHPTVTTQDNPLFYSCLFAHLYQHSLLHQEGTLLTLTVDLIHMSGNTQTTQPSQTILDSPIQNHECAIILLEKL